MAYQLTINPLWVPQRRGIAENELADDLALSIVGVRPIETEPFLKVGPHKIRKNSAQKKGRERQHISRQHILIKILSFLRYGCRNTGAPASA